MTRPDFSPLAVLRTRPETVRDDTARLLAMSGFAPTSVAVVAVLGDDPAPWLLYAARAAVLAAGASAPVPRLGPEVGTALHLTGVDLHDGLGIVGCLAALGRLGEAAGGGRREDPVARTLAAASELPADGVDHVFLVDATLVPGLPRVGAPLRARNLLMAGRDPVALDAFAARLCGLQPHTLPLLARAEAAGLGRIDPAHDLRLGYMDALTVRAAVAWRPGGAGSLIRFVWALGDRFARPGAAFPSDSPWVALRHRPVDPEPQEESRHV